MPDTLIHYLLYVTYIMLLLVRGMFSGSGNALQSIRNRVSSNNLQISSFSNGGSGPLIALGPDEFVKNVKRWETSATATSTHVVISNFLYPYYQLGEELLPQEYRDQMIWLRLAAQRTVQISNLQADLDFIKQHPEDFLQKEANAFSDSLAGLGRLSRRLEGAATKCKESATDCTKIGDFQTPDVASPRRIPWQYISVTNNSFQRVGLLTPEVTERTLVVRGQWSLWAQGKGPLMDPWDYDSSSGSLAGLFVRFSNESGRIISDNVRIPKAGVVTIPASRDNVVVEVVVRDGNPGDNRSDGLRAAVVNWMR